MKKLISIITLLLALINMAYAQSWSLNGNAVADSSKLGSTNNKPVRFFTNNLERMRLTTTGNLGLGTQSPGARLHVVSSSSNVATFDAPQGANISFYESGVYRGYAGSYSGAANDVDFGTGAGNITGKLHLTIQTNPKLTIDASGKVGIGTTTPGFPLNFPSTLGDKIALWGNSGAHYGFGVQSALLQIHTDASFSDIAFGYGSSASFTEKMRIKGNGNVGIGTSAPESNLHVFRGSAGSVTANSNAVLVVENAANNYINLLTPSTSESGVLFGDNLNVQDGGIIYNGANQMHLRTNGNVNRLTIDPDGNTGIDLDPINSGFNAAKLQIHSDSRDNIRFVSPSSTNDWSMFSEDGADGGHLDLFRNGILKGYFDAGNGMYSPSDKRLKKDITELPPVLQYVMKLKPSKYHYIDNTDNTKYSFGFIAQEVEKVFPDFVGSYKDRNTGEKMYAINYDNFGVLAIKAVQELSMQNNDLKKDNTTLQAQLESLQSQLDELRALIVSVGQCIPCNTTTGSPAFQSQQSRIQHTDGALKQNVPNPLRTGTTIRYTLPQQYSNAKIVITDNNGKTLKSINVSGNGKGSVQVDASTLAAGAYKYALYINNQLIGSKQMVVAK